MDFFAAAPLLLALTTGAFAVRTRAVWTLGRYGDALSPAFFLILWFCFLYIGQWTGSLRGMAWLAAAPIALSAAFAFSSGWRRRTSLRWTWVDWYLFVIVCLLLVVFNGEDNACHYSVISTYLRGNIPPSALNDPSAPLAYHSVFDASAAVLMRALGIQHRAAIAAVSIACFYAAFRSLHALSRLIFDSDRTRQLGRILFLFGFGPIYLRLLEPGPHAAKPDYYLNGDTAMPFLESILRRPLGIGWTILLFSLGAAMSLRKDRARWVVLLPCAFLIPQTAEELSLLATAAVCFIWIQRKGKGPIAEWKFVAGWCATLLCSWMLSGLGRDLLYPHAAVAAPHPALAWPWTLPSRDIALRATGLPLLSWKALWTLLVEWGPLFFAGLVFAWRDRRRRAPVLIFALGFASAAALGLRGWAKSDLDRALFYGTALGFMLAAPLIERLPRALGYAALILTVLGPAGYALRSMAINDADAFISSDPIALLQTALAPVGPKELVATDARLAQQLVLAGFVVAAPMRSQWIGRVDVDRLTDFLKSPDVRPDWYFLPGKNGSYRLERASR